MGLHVLQEHQHVALPDLASHRSANTVINLQVMHWITVWEAISKEKCIYNWSFVLILGTRFSPPVG